MKTENLKAIKNLRHDLHKIPEPSMQEFNTKKFLMDWLDKNTANIKIVDKGNYFYAYYHVGEAAKNIAFRADMDALPIPEGKNPPPWASTNPGWAHKCGHDGHMAGLCGLALEIDQAADTPKACKNNIYFLFQPGEETGEGALTCTGFFKEKEVKHIDAFFAYHNGALGDPHNLVMIREGPMFCASTGLLLEFVGTPTHASTPKNGKNPTRAMADVINAIPNYFDLWKYGKKPMCTVCYVEAGEPVYGSAAGTGKIHLTCRAWFDTDMQDAMDSLIDYAKQRGAEDGLEVIASYHEKFAATINTPEMVTRVRQAASKLHYPILMLDEPVGGSEDFGVFLQHAPGAMWGMSFGMNHPGIHDAHYQFQDSLLGPAVRMFLELAYQEY
jgi:amidohydrolase